MIFADITNFGSGIKFIMIAAILTAMAAGLSGCVSIPIPNSISATDFLMPF